ncbi:hypothetical protein IW140_000417 [Coemansia sp. RSA 1813]|nr:hypothetical protein EV178_000624 [Coemansia sp. RSA 1646]KAJ1773288.1 hypothetical protein LPJ74_000799 [Coemansia sp. RSA 1843]KAJ2092756.1 hypothetical protein IW138_000851 [Coemansia sp. RSA 986]KAJ2217745.1 hypothetical protein EV179_000230 [Coemansia sp. RSA 487]KAJ2573018.1 hypothetical protein IW140_000417 [Coemansia sp. RSA 1813]
MITYSSRDPEWKKEFVELINKECEHTHERFPAMSLATVDVEGRPAVRTVSPRGFVGDGFLRINKDDQGQWSSDVLTFCTHAKSSKVHELVGTGDVQLVFWLQNSRVQIRCGGHAHLLFHPENPHYSTLSLDIRHRVWPRDKTSERTIGGQTTVNGNGNGSGLDEVGVEIDDEFIREQAYLHHSPVIQAWYSWPAPGKVRLADPSLYPAEIPLIKDKEEKARFEANARRNYVLVFVDVNHVDIVDLNKQTRKIYTRRSDTSWAITDASP